MILIAETARKWKIRLRALPLSTILHQRTKKRWPQMRSGDRHMIASNLRALDDRRLHAIHAEGPRVSHSY
jgi:hypothetical protein